jgi:excisionase family DNA binding protein
VTADPETRVRAAVAELADAIVALAAAEHRPSTTAPVELLSVAEFAHRAGIGRSSAYLMVADGTLRSVRLRNRRLVPASELGRLAESALPT